MAEPARLLIVDDDNINRMMLSYGVQQQGHIASQAEGGVQALQMLREESFDVVLLDLLMPDMDGFEVLEQIKADSTLREIPVIMVSALDEIDSVVRCIETGAEDYLPKPFNPVLLKARVDACVAKKRWRDQEVQYLQQVSLLTTAAAQIEASSFDIESVSGVAQRDDELGSLARMLQRMAREIHAREAQLRQQVQQLKIEVDEAKKSRQVAEVTETDYFRELQGRADRLRARPAGRVPAVSVAAEAQAP
jgi:two-component system, cell cycle response regulator